MCLWPIESYDFTVFDLKSITWNESDKRQEKLFKQTLNLENKTIKSTAAL